MDPWRWLQQLTPQLYHAICKGQIFPPSAHLFLFHCLLACCYNRQSVDVCSIQQLPPWLLSLHEHNDSWQDDDDDDTVRTNDDTMTKTWGHKEDMTTTWWWRHSEKSHHTKEVDPKKPTLMAEVKYIKRGGKILLKGTFQHLRTDELAELWQKNRITSAVAFSWRMNLACFRKPIKEVEYKFKCGFR